MVRCGIADKSGGWCWYNVSLLPRFPAQIPYLGCPTNKGLSGRSPEVQAARAKYILHRGYIVHYFGVASEKSSF